MEHLQVNYDMQHFRDGKSIMHKPSSRQITLSITFLGTPFAFVKSILQKQSSGSGLFYWVSIRTSLHFCEFSDDFCNILFLWRRGSKGNESQQVHICLLVYWPLLTFYILVKNVLCSSTQGRRMIVQWEVFLSHLPRQLLFFFIFFQL